MKKAIYLLVLVIVAVGAYQIGWWRSVRYQTVSQALAQGNTDLAVLRALEKGDQHLALSLLETSIRSSVITLYGFKTDIPKAFIEPAKLFSSHTAGVYGLDPAIAEGPPRLPWGTHGYLLTLPKGSSSALEPGQYMDISVAYGSKAFRSTASVVRHVLVVAVSEGIGKEKESRMFMLAVTPEEAGALKQALQKDHATLSIQKAQSAT